MSTNALPELDFELVLSDGEPLETHFHVLQMVLFLELVRYRMAQLGQERAFAGGDMFVYYSLEQARAVAEEEHQMALFESGLRPDKPKKTAFRGPDAFLVKDAVQHDRDVWKVWEEDGRYPDLILELLSPSTWESDYTEKKRIYQDVFGTSEYFLFTPNQERVDAFRLLDGRYQKIVPSSSGRLWSRELELEVGTWHGTYEGQAGRWLRLFHPDGHLVPTKDERAEQERQRAEQAEERVEQERQRAEQADQRAEQERQRAEQAEERARAAERELARLRSRLGE